MNCPILNKNQKRVRIVSLLLIVAVILTWLYYGAEIFTKTEVLVEVNDDLYGTVKEWKDQFILGLDYTLGIIGGIIAIGITLILLLRTKKIV
jgi:TRAP-type C4-dicarboxylate transport system permease small subunit